MDSCREPVALLREEDGLVTNLKPREQIVQVASVRHGHRCVSFAVEDEGVRKG